MTDLLLEATGVAKRYGAVAALRDASLSVRRGEVHALMGANGAGKSTLVKILTGTVRSDGGTIAVGGTARQIRSPMDARRAGVVSVYQDPSLIPDLTISQNLRLMDVPPRVVRDWLDRLGIGGLAFDTYARDLPLPTMRVLDLARALAVEPDILMLDEMTAALPADLTERVLEVVGRQRDSGKSVIFISHRLIEISRLCDRATVLRDGATVGVVDMTAGAPERIVSLMLGPVADEDAAPPAGTPASAPSVTTGPLVLAGSEGASGVVPRLAVRDLHAGTHLVDVSFDLRAGEVLGIVALEGQGQDELFEVLAGSRKAQSGQLLVDGTPVRFSHPADAIRAGLVYVPADRLQGLLPQRSVHENIALPFSAAMRDWGRLDVGREKRTVAAAIERLQIDTRAQSEVRRLSGGNQQKVTIARWIATGVRTLLCFDPTRGIDVGTKRQIYQLLRELAAAGTAVLLYTSELEEVQLTCDRAVVIFGGRVVAEVPAAEADEPTLLRAAYALPKDAPIPDGELALVGGPTRDRRMTATPTTVEPAGAGLSVVAQRLRRSGWTIALIALMGGLIALARIIRTEYGASDLQSLSSAVLPVAFATAAQAVVVISGGIDLSIGSMMAFTNVAGAALMKDQGEPWGLVVVALVLLLGFAAGALNGLLIVISRVPDIIVTLAMSFVWAGAALLILETPGGGAAAWLKSLSVGYQLTEWLPSAFLMLLVGVGAVWIPLRRSRLGLSIYAIGSDQVAALRSGVNVSRTKVAAYAIGGLFAAMGGLALTMNTGIGTPVPGPYTLASVAAIVLGGVSLVGGRGGMFGPIVAAFILALIRYDLFFLGVDPNYSTVIQGVILVIVVMIGGLVMLRSKRATG